MSEFDDIAPYILGSDYFTQDHLYHGVMGEKIIGASIKTTMKSKDGFKIEHNCFGKKYRYVCGMGADFKIHYQNELTEIEVKNLKEQNRPYGTDFVVRHVIPRFQKGNHVKILVLTYAKLLTRKAIQHLKHHGIQLITTEKRLTPENYFLNDNLNNLYVLGNQIYQTIQTKKPPNFL